MFFFSPSSPRGNHAHPACFYRFSPSFLLVSNDIFLCVLVQTNQQSLRMIQNVSPECLKAFAQGWLWLDFISVPQVTVSPEDSDKGGRMEGEMVRVRTYAYCWAYNLLNRS